MTNSRLEATNESAVFGAVVTTIQAPTECLTRLAERMREERGRLVVVGDTKTPPGFQLEGVAFLSIEAQFQSGSRFALELPRGHYARKNLGYLDVIRAGAAVVYETDDDNAPLPGWGVRQEETNTSTCRGDGWVNAYRHFTAEAIWPRGLPLDAVLSKDGESVTSDEVLARVRAPIQQGLANGEPDVDAVWRLTMQREVTFNEAPSLLLPPGAWCPFNSQSTWWFPVAYPLLYLPSFCSFRMTDIWRSFVAQRCLWELGIGVVFHGPEVVQERNVHNLMRDFEQEVPGYLGNRRMAKVLAETSLRSGEDQVGPNLIRCYEALVGAGFFQEKEAALVDLWLEEFRGAAGPRKAEA